MSKLELKIPPVALVLLFVAAMYLLSGATGGAWIAGAGLRFIAVALALGGAIIAATGVAQFRKAHTTVNPVSPSSSSSLVTGGIYRFSRNPMYLGFLLALAGWAVFLGNPFAAALVPLFVAYMNRFQIVPEERALAGIFGSEFTTYMSRVRRWL